MGEMTSHEVVEREGFLRGWTVSVCFEHEIAGEDIWVLDLRENGAGKFEAVIREGVE